MTWRNHTPSHQSNAGKSKRLPKHIYKWLYCFTCGSSHLHKLVKLEWQCPNCHSTRIALKEDVLNIVKHSRKVQNG